MAEKRVSVRFDATGGEKLRAAFTDVGVAGEGLSRRMANVTSESRRLGLGVQNAAFQIGDFAVQVAGGTSATRAMAQQLPQLLGGFGILGAVAGAAAAILIPLAGRLFGAGDAAKSTEEQLRSLTDATQAYERAAELAAVPIEKLREKYGELADEVQRARIAEAEAARDRALRATRETIASLGGGLGNGAIVSGAASVGATARQLAQAQLDYRSAVLAGNATLAAEFAGLEQELTAQIAAVSRISDEYKIGEENALALARAVAAFRDTATGTAAEQVGAATALRDMVVEVFGSVDAANEATDGLASKLSEAVIEAASVAATDMAGPIGKAADEASRLATELADASRASANAALEQMKVEFGFQGVSLRRYGSRGATSTRAIEDQFGNRLDNARRPRAVGGGGQGALNETMREAKRIYDETRTAAEKYALEEERLNALRQSGAIDAETYGRAMEQLKNEYQDQGDMLRDVGRSVKSALSGVFDSIFDGGGKAIDVIKNLARELATMALEAYAFQALAGLFPRIFGAGGSVPLIGNAMGNAFDGGRVVPFASGGIVGGPTLFPMRGGAGLMGEAGPEAILPLTRVGGRLGVASGGGGTVVQIVNYTGAPVREERRRGPDGRELVVATIGEEMARGGFDGQMRRYGAQPRQVKR